MIENWAIKASPALLVKPISKLCLNFLQYHLSSINYFAESEQEYLLVDNVLKFIMQIE